MNTLQLTKQDKELLSDCVAEVLDLRACKRDFWLSPEQIARLRELKLRLQ